MQNIEPLYVVLKVQSQPSWHILTASLLRVKTPTPNDSPGYGIKPSGGEASTLDLWGNLEYPFIVISPWSTLT